MSTGADETATMRAWRVHPYGAPLEVLHLDTVAVPTPEYLPLLPRSGHVPPPSVESCHW